MTLPAPRSPVLASRWAIFTSNPQRLDLTRGKPSDEQVRLCEPMFEYRPTVADLNYGAIEGLPAARRLFAEMLGTPWEQTFVSGGGSLAIMHRIISEMRGRHEKPSMICLSPGYDRHSAACKKLGVEILRVALNNDGPDMGAVEELAQRPEVIGMWCVPIYSNPSGITYSKEVCRRLAEMPTNARFRLVWDLAYLMHHLEEHGDTLPNILELCRHFGNDDRAFMIASTSKMTCPDQGLGILTSSEANMDWYRSILDGETIGHNKRSQAEHVAFFRDVQGIHDHMAKHRAILRPKFDVVQDVLRRELGNSGFATWTDPRGGYFVLLTLRQGLSARKVVKRCAEAGLLVTPAGSTDPYGQDDSIIRIAPTYPSLYDLSLAMAILTTAIKVEADLI